MKTVIITGSVASGKTTLAKKLSKKLNYGYVDVNKIIKDNNISSGYDRKRKCKIIDTKKLNSFLIKIIKKSKKNLVIDSHLSHYLPKKFVNNCIVTKCNLKELKRRLIKRKYSKSKIEENLECEIMDICLNEVKEMHNDVLVINATKPINMGKLTKILQG